jgi:hypothetical protein
MAVRPVFIFSTSRSGSTLLQRILATHRGVATASEPWLMLPHAYTFRQRGIDAEYMHPLLSEAVMSFAERLPRGELDYREEVRELGLRLYAKAAGPDAELFIDKSPPYCLISSGFRGWSRASRSTAPQATTSASRTWSAAAPATGKISPTIWGSSSSPTR